MHDTTLRYVTMPEAVAMAARAGKTCLLCHKPAIWRALFMPQDPRCWPGPPIQPGHLRAFFYGLCKKCAKRRDRLTAVEDEILAVGKEQATLH